MVSKVNVDVEVLREAIKEEYQVVASQPDKGFHFHTGRPPSSDPRLQGRVAGWHTRDVRRGLRGDWKSLQPRQAGAR